MFVVILSALLVSGFAFSSSNDLQLKLQNLVSESDGRIGICILDLSEVEPICVNGEQKFQLQSVMKMVVAASVLDAVDRGLIKLNELIVVRPEDASPGPQEFANLVKSKGRLSITIETLIRQAVIDSDSTSVDVLLKRIGGPTTVQQFLEQRQIKGMRIDRDERHVQSESVGLQWRNEYADPGKFEAAVKALAVKDRDLAWTNHLRDERDSSTPKGMVFFLKALASGKLLSAVSTKKLLSTMNMTVTGPDRLMAGTPKNWSIAHKTGTGRTWKGMNAATNDVGVLLSPAGRQIAVAAFVTESMKSNEHRASVIANAARLATESSSKAKL